MLHQSNIHPVADVNISSTNVIAQIVTVNTSVHIASQRERTERNTKMRAPRSIAGIRA
jgi:hypothetical protein